MMTETIPSVQTCRYCGGHLRPSLTEEGLLPLCGPSLRIGFVCESCGQLEAPFPPITALSIQSKKMI